MSKVIDRRRELRNDKHDEDAIDAIVLAEQVERIADVAEKAIGALTAKPPMLTVTAAMFEEADRVRKAEMHRLFMAMCESCRDKFAEAGISFNPEEPPNGDAH